MNTIRRDGQDTGEQDVRELRRLHAGGTPTPSVDNIPYVRDKEDVPHEDSLPDLYGLDEDVPTIQEVKDELSRMVDAGELCMGWDEEQEAFTYWFPEDSEEVWEEVTLTPAKSRRKPARRRRRAGSRVILALVASVAPLFAGMVAEAAMDEHAERHSQGEERADLAADDWAEEPAPDPSPVAASTHTFEDRPTATSYARHIRPTPTPTVEQPKTYIGKHRKTSSAAVSKPQTPEKRAAKTPKKTVPATARKTTTPSSSTPSTATEPASPKYKNPVQEVVNHLLDPVESLLG